MDVWGLMRVIGGGRKCVATEPECSVKKTTLRRTLQTRRTDSQELDPSEYRRSDRDLSVGFTAVAAMGV